MKIDLLINGVDAYATYGVRMGDGFLEAIGAPAATKEYIENESRLEHGKRVVTEGVKIASRDVNLEFTIQGSSIQDYHDKKAAFFSILYLGGVTISVPDDGPDVYHLVYKGTSPTYGLSRSRKFGKVMIKFEEPNPMHRTSE